MTTLSVVLAPTIYLFTTHITQKKIIVGAVLAAVVVVGAAAWLVRRRLGRIRKPSS